MKKILLTMCAMSAALALADPAFARKSRHFDGVAKGPHGRERTISRDVERGGGERSARTQVTGENGRSAILEKNASVDREAGLAERSKTFTGPDGKTRSVDATASKTGDGQYDIDRTVTGFNGDTRTQTGSASVTRTGNGYSASGSLTGEKGTTTFDRSATREDGVRTVTGDATGPNGGTRSVDRTHDFKNGTYDSTRALTGPDGKTRTVETDAARDGDAISGTQTVTGPKGNTRTRVFLGGVTSN